MNMTKKKASVSSRPGKLISVRAESIFSKPPGKAQKAVLSRIAKRLVSYKEVYDWLMQYGKGYPTRINSILRAVMERAG
jgi:uncharacterized protein (DUF4415 family)